MPLTTNILESALARWAVGLDEAAPELNRLDAQLGDGDLGTTLIRCAANVRAALTSPQENLGKLFGACAQACASASGSSFGTLLAIAFLSASKHAGARSRIDWNEIPDLLQAALSAMSARGGAQLGDKTVLDTLAAACEATRGSDDPVTQYDRALTAVNAAIQTMRQRSSRIGRARMFGERSVGLDDPGMIAFEHMLRSLRR